MGISNRRQKQDARVTERKTLFLDLPEHIITYIVDCCRQREVCQLSLTCKNLNQVATNKLYRHLYFIELNRRIPTQRGQSSSRYEVYHDRDRHEHLRQKWTTVLLSYGHDLYSFAESETQAHRLLRSLKENRRLFLKIKFIYTTDFQFLMFNFKTCFTNEYHSGYRKLQIFSKIQFISVDSLAHIFDLVCHPGGDSLGRGLVHSSVSGGVSLCATNHETKFIQSFGHHRFINKPMWPPQLKELMILYNSTEMIEFPIPPSFLKILQQQIRKLSILSMHKLGLKVFEKLASMVAAGDTQKLWLDAFAISHVHGNSRCLKTSFLEDIFHYEAEKEMSLDFSLLDTMIDVPELQELELRIGCNHCYKREEFDENPECLCIESFFKDLGVALTKDPNKLERLAVMKVCDNVVYNTTGLATFKESLISIFQPSICSNLKYLYLNLNCDCYHCQLTKLKLNLLTRHDETIEVSLYGRNQIVDFAERIFDHFSIILSVIKASDFHKNHHPDFTGSYNEYTDYTPHAYSKSYTSKASNGDVITLHNIFRHHEVEQMFPYKHPKCYCKKNDLRLIITMLVHELRHDVEYFVDKLPKLKVLILNEIYFEVQSYFDELIGETVKFGEAVCDNYYDFSKPETSRFSLNSDSLNSV
ncbi:hypothetical protein BABINDRAFT_5335 [Babjeviella inositovora NRRL Y-12698]|uniref:F-box domain-containing protein n=1 Tax=Babjeviella inositovora NRRL Y-12698 TaxID=984486 RepID=A0A1E3QXL1_9ASCO|nr:uncharacterized protein BABINDRAFT_5335 [Babjeviella inositovora NRRL Y-12698]ODQ82351.1 hypothetical protein BABINDRAFT_5335 [Babjeviella inositovora NRRL Y-12698]